MPNESKLIDQVKDSFAKAECGESKLPSDIYEGGLHKDGKLQGMSSPKVRHFLNNLCDFEGVRYLEIGTYLGSTVISAAYENNGVFVAVDDFRWNGGTAENTNLTTREALDQNLKRFDSEGKIIFIDSECWSLDQNRLPSPFNVYFYDGDHSQAAQKQALMHYKNRLTDEFIFVVDDWQENGNKVPSGTYQGIQEGGFEIIYETVAPHGEYHMGLGIFVLKKKE